jgi:hypothetical protein
LLKDFVQGGHSDLLGNLTGAFISETGDQADISTAEQPILNGEVASFFQKLLISSFNLPNF